MANPNIVNVSTINGKTAVLTLTTSTTNIVTNSAGSNKVYKLDSLYVANTTTSVATVTIDVLRSSVSYRLASAISVPANATLLVVDKTTNLFLEEGDTLRGSAGANNALQLVTSYEEIS
jgi:hypothetical protein